MSEANKAFRKLRDIAKDGKFPFLLPLLSCEDVEELSESRLRSIVVAGLVVLLEADTEEVKQLLSKWDEDFVASYLDRIPNEEVLSILGSALEALRSEEKELGPCPYSPDERTGFSIKSI